MDFIVDSFGIENPNEAISLMATNTNLNCTNDRNCKPPVKPLE